MRINQITNQNFESKNFKQVVGNQLYIRIGTKMTSYATTGRYVKVYSNPHAEELYKKAQQTKDYDERIRLLDQMGDYELIDLNTKAKLNKVINKSLT